MRKSILMAMAFALVCVAIAPVFAAAQTTGNGSLSGAHYNLNIIGVPNQKNLNFDGGNGARIFVLRDQPTRFDVYGDDTTSYAVLDHDGTDGTVGTGVDNPGITFPYDETSGTWQVEIYVRLLGPKDSTIHWKTFYDYDGTAWLQVTEFDLAKSSKFSLKTGQLLIDGYQDILWELDPTNNFRILQMRIYLTDA
jgi:hypothetical protein